MPRRVCVDALYPQTYLTSTSLLAYLKSCGNQIINLPSGPTLCRYMLQKKSSIQRDQVSRQLSKCASLTLPTPRASSHYHTLLVFLFRVGRPGGDIGPPSGADHVLLGLLLLRLTLALALPPRDLHVLRRAPLRATHPSVDAR